MELSEYEKLQPNATEADIRFFTPNTHCLWRVDSLLTKEPDTIAWINGMDQHDILYDVGANMGQYAMFAAKRGLTVHAFEPESQNFALLCRNIALNKLPVTAWPLALSDKSGLDVFHVTTVMPGGSCHSYGEQVNYMLQPKDFAFKQGSCATTIDEFANQYGAPQHIKIDVDGFEHKVLEGAKMTLLLVKSVLVEINTHLQEHRDIHQMMANLGFEFDKAQADAARRKEGPFAGIGNVIFYR